MCRHSPGISTDNVPGVRGIGVKTAAQLIEEFGDLETLLARASEIKQPKRREALIENAENARLSKKLVTLVEDVALETPLGDLILRPPPASQLVAFLKAMEFTTITRRVGELYSVDIGEIEADERLRIGGSADPRAGMAAASPAQADSAPTKQAGAEIAATKEGGKAAKTAAREAALATGSTPSALAAERLAEAASARIDRSAYETVASPERLDAWVDAARAIGLLAIDTETTSLDAMQGELIGVSMALAPGKACYIPLGHRAQGGDGGLFDGGLLKGQIDAGKALHRLKPLLEDASVLKIGQNLKYDWLVLARHGIEIAPYDDTMLMSYVLDAGRGNNGMDELSQRWLGHKPLQYGEVAGQGKSFIGFDRVPIERATEFAAEDADITLRLWRLFKPRLISERLISVYETLERRMIEVLARMERRGIAIDRQILSRGSPASSPRPWEGSKPRSAHSPANPSTLVPRSSWATSCSARWACPAAPGPRPVPGRPRPGPWTISPSRAMNCPSASSNGASFPS